MTANDSVVSEGDSLQGSQVVRVYLRDGVTPSYSLWFEGVQYTPLYHGEDYDEFIIGDNGEVTILDDGQPYISFSVEGIVVPEGLPSNMRMYLIDSIDTSPSPERVKHRKNASNVNCINYPYKNEDGYPYFLFYLGNRRFGRDDFAIVNGQIEGYIYYSNSTRINMSVLNHDEPAYLTYQGFIIAVFNYTN